MRKFFKKKNKGFTLVETLVAISIFTTSILALMVVLTQSIADTNYAKTKMAATYMAQEGIEYMRNMRDTFVLFDPALVTPSQVGWDKFKAKLTAASCDQANGCFFDDQNLDYAIHSQQMTAIALTACGATCPVLKYDATTGKYGYASGVDSGFTRKIFLILSSTNEVKFSSTVSWKQSSGNYSVTFSESLYNWVE